MYDICSLISFDTVKIYPLYKERQSIIIICDFLLTYYGIINVLLYVYPWAQYYV